MTIRARANRASRLRAIRQIIKSRAVATQQDLVDLLHRKGFAVNQGTLSRDLAFLGAARVHGPDGSAFYELSASAPGRDEVSALGEMVYAIDENGSLVVLQTQAGAASTIARTIDLARLPECLGTIAGDDTVFATPAKHATAAKMRKRLLTFFGKGEPS